MVVSHCRSFGDCSALPKGGAHACRIKRLWLLTCSGRGPNARRSLCLCRLEFLGPSAAAVGVCSGSGSAPSEGLLLMAWEG
jgi:hypothetical protein